MDQLKRDAKASRCRSELPKNLGVSILCLLTNPFMVTDYIQSPHGLFLWSSVKFIQTEFNLIACNATGFVSISVLLLLSLCCA
jgi:hypothetical protein